MFDIWAVLVSYGQLCHYLFSVPQLGEFSCYDQDVDLKKQVMVWISLGEEVFLGEVAGIKTKGKYTTNMVAKELGVNQ